MPFCGLLFRAFAYFVVSSRQFCIGGEGDIFADGSGYPRGGDACQSLCGHCNREAGWGESGRWLIGYLDIYMVEGDEIFDSWES